MLSETCAGPVTGSIDWMRATTSLSKEHHAGNTGCQTREYAMMSTVSPFTRTSPAQVAFGAVYSLRPVCEMFVAHDLPDLDVDGRGVEIRRVARAVEARDARLDDHVAAAHFVTATVPEPLSISALIERSFSI